jgi:RND family efflux transporter MFP subunit
MRFSFPITVASGLLAALLISCGKTETAPARTPQSLPAREVQVTQATLRPMERSVQVIGTLAARDAATISAQVAGQLEQNLVDLGDHVQAGQEIALIDTTSYEALAAAAAANLTRAQASAANAAQNLKRIQDLQRDRIASTSDLEAAVADAARTRAEVKAAEANNAIAQLQLARSRVKAPFAGAIAERLASIGDYLAVGTPIVRLVQTDPLRLQLEVPERESAVVRVGQPVRIRIEGDTNVYHGTLTRVAPALRAGSRMLPVEADVPNPDGLRAGTFARAQIIVTANEPALSVPADALLTFAGLEKVVLVKDGKAAEQNVTTGRRAGDWVEITNGLETNATIVLAPAGIRTGQPLVITSGPATMAAQTNTSR